MFSSTALRQLSPADRKTLERVLASHPRQRGFEKEAKAVLPRLASTTISAYYQQASKAPPSTTTFAPASTKRPPAALELSPPRKGKELARHTKLPKLETVSPPPQVYLPYPITPVTPTGSTPCTAGIDVVRPSPRGSVTVYTPRKVKQGFKSIRVDAKQLESMVEHKSSEKISAGGTSTSLQVEPRTIAVGENGRGWQRNQVKGEPLRATLESSGSFEVTTEWAGTVYRFHIPLTNLGGLSFDLSSAILKLTLVCPPSFFRRPASSRGKWTPCDDFTPNRVASTLPSFFIHLDPTSSSSRTLADHPLIKPLMVEAPVTPTTSDARAPPRKLKKDSSPGARLFAAAHSQAVAQRSPSPLSSSEDLIITYPPAKKRLLPAAPIYNISFPSFPSSVPLSTETDADAVSRKADELDFDAWYRGEACVEMINTDDWW